MKYVHNPDLTCLAQLICFDANQGQIERYTFPFSAPPGMVKTAVRKAVAAALESRAKRRMTSGRIHVELDEDNPGSGRVVDHLPRGDGRAVLDGQPVVVHAEEVVAEPVVLSAPEPAPQAEPEVVKKIDDSLLGIEATLTKQELMGLLDERGKVNKQPHQIGETVYQPRTLRLAGTKMECDRAHGVYKGVIQIRRVDPQDDSKAVDFSRIPGLKHLVKAG